MGNNLSMRGRGGLRGAFALLVVAAFGAAAAPAEVRVRDAGGGRLTVEAHDATLRQVLDALRAVRPLQLHGSDALTRPVSGTYSGSLSHVLSRLLDGYNHVIHLSAAGVELDIFDSSPGNRATVRATVRAASPVVAVPSNGHAVSSNIDRDDEAAEAVAAPPRATPAPVVPAKPAVVVTGSVRSPDARRISSNLDLDEEPTSR